MFTIDSLFSILQYSVRRYNGGYTNLKCRLVSATFRDIVEKLTKCKKELKTYSIRQALLKIEKKPFRILRVNADELKRIWHGDKRFLAIQNNVNWYIALRENGTLIQKLTYILTEEHCICAASVMGMNIILHTQKKYWTPRVLEAALKPYNLDSETTRHILRIPFFVRKYAENIQQTMIYEMMKVQGNVPEQYRMYDKRRYL